jgi:hypothetical protein
MNSYPKLLEQFHSPGEDQGTLRRFELRMGDGELAAAWKVNWMGRGDLDVGISRYMTGRLMGGQEGLALVARSRVVGLDCVIRLS